MTVALTPDELLTTTRSVRKRLDLTRPVPLDLVLECLELALQAPSGSNRQGWHWLVVTDLQTRARIGELYRRGAPRRGTWRLRIPLPVPAVPVRRIQTCSGG
jgi:nitroreductase